VLLVLDWSEFDVSCVVCCVTVCDACGSVGHIKRQCPTVKRRDEDDGRSRGLY